MVGKIIKIEKCTNCPYLSHTGAFTKGGSKPCCDHSDIVNKKGDNCFNRIIPYKNEWTHLHGRNLTFKVPKSIPNWCPLSEAGKVEVAKYKGNLDDRIGELEKKVNKVKILGLLKVLEKKRKL